jgi:hypothetical protein
MAEAAAISVPFSLTHTLLHSLLDLTRHLFSSRAPRRLSSFPPAAPADRVDVYVGIWILVFWRPTHPCPCRSLAASST